MVVLTKHPMGLKKGAKLTGMDIYNLQMDPSPPPRVTRVKPQNPVCGGGGGGCGLYVPKKSVNKHFNYELCTHWVLQNESQNVLDPFLGFWD